jgi:hypothetical protein
MPRVTWLGLDTSEWATVASTAFTALAAGAAWATVRQSARERREARIPALHVEVTEDLDSGAIGFHIENYGGDLAKLVSFVVVEGTQVAAGFLPPAAILRSGEGATMRTALASTGSHQAKAVVICHDAAGRYVHAWDVTGQHKQWRRRRWPERPKGGEWILRKFYPGMSLDSLTPVRHELRERTGPGH